MARVARIDGEQLFGASRWAALNARTDWRGIALVLHAWVVIIAAITAAVLMPHPVGILLAVMVIGSRQLGLSILMHDAAHGLLLRNTTWNDRVGQWLCAYPVGLDLRAYRAYHLKHHQFAQQDEDPDLSLSAPFPVTKARFARKVARDLMGLPFLKLRVLPLLLAGIGRHKLRSADIALVGYNAVFATVAFALDAGWVWLTLWLLPAATWHMLVVRLRNIAEHGGMTRDNDPWRVARTTQANWLSRAFIAPYYVNYHAEHHLFMWTPCYRLPVIHRALRERGLLDAHAMPVAPGYSAVWQAVTR